MSVRHWFLSIGFALAVIGLMAVGETGWPHVLLLFGGGLIGIWASEGVNANARKRGITLDPL